MVKKCSVTASTAKLESYKRIKCSADMRRLCTDKMKYHGVTESSMSSILSDVPLSVQLAGQVIFGFWGLSESVVSLLALHNLKGMRGIYPAMFL